MKHYLLLLFLPALLFAGIGNVAAVKGVAKIERNARSIAVKYGSAIEEKDKIITQNNSKVQIILKDQTIVTIGENSKYSFSEYKYNTKADSKVKMKLNHGFFRVITGKIGKLAPERFKVQSKSATIGIRGTHFFGLVQKKLEEYGCIGGKISVFTKLQKFKLNAGQKVVFQNGVWRMMPISKKYNKKLKNPVKNPAPAAGSGQNQQNILIRGENVPPIPIPTPPGPTPPTPTPPGPTPPSPTPPSPTPPGPAQPPVVYPPMPIAPPPVNPPKPTPPTPPPAPDSGGGGI